MTEWTTIASEDEKLDKPNLNYCATLAHTWFLNFTAVRQILEQYSSPDQVFFYIDPNRLFDITLKEAAVNATDLDYKGYPGKWFQNLLREFEYSDSTLSKHVLPYVNALFFESK